MRERSHRVPQPDPADDVEGEVRAHVQTSQRHHGHHPPRDSPDPRRQVRCRSRHQGSRHGGMPRRETQTRVHLSEHRIRNKPLGPLPGNEHLDDFREEPRHRSGHGNIASESHSASQQCNTSGDGHRCQRSGLHGHDERTVQYSGKLICEPKRRDLDVADTEACRPAAQGNYQQPCTQTENIAPTSHHLCCVASD